uniref:Ribosomal silencing factor RsfS n=1 Tax=candidate division WOR-3 bacterium TaxID=2052148 RepID=A0A7C4CCG2_UNCW3
MNSERLARSLAMAAHRRLAENVTVLDLRGESVLADFFVIATAKSTIHARAIADDMIGRRLGVAERPHHSEGLDNGQWVLLDYVDVVVHIFLSDVREFYGLERLWGDAPRWAVGNGEESETRSRRTPHGL